MRSTILVLCCLLTASCSMTPTQKKYTALGISVLAFGLVVAHGHGDNRPAAAGPIGPGPSCKTQPNGSCR